MIKIAVDQKQLEVIRKLRYLGIVLTGHGHVKCDKEVMSKTPHLKYAVKY